MPTFDEVADLLPRDAWITLGTTLSLFAFRFVCLCLRRKPKEKGKDEVLVDNVLATLLSADLVADSTPAFWVRTGSRDVEVDWGRRTLSVGGKRMEGQLSRRQAKRLFGHVQSICAATDKKVNDTALARAIQHTAPRKENALLDTPWTLDDKDEA